MIKKLLFSFFLIFIQTIAIAGVTGKISGLVVDTQTGEPLPGANILIEGTALGASTDVEGFFVILNISPGIYNLELQYIGYTTTRVSDVSVSIDLTTSLKLQMSETTLDAAETIVVVADKPLIRKDEISTRHFVSGEEIELQPIKSFQEAAKNQAGVVGSHFRGGRSSEVLIMIDGIPVRDQAGVYSGNMGGFTGGVPKDAIEEMEVSLGGFSAEYGNVQSGIINLALKEGAKKFSGRFRLTNMSEIGSESSFSEKKHQFNRLDQKENIYEFSLFGPIVSNKLSFSLSGRVLDKDQGVYMNQKSFDQSYQGKLTYRFTPQHKLSFGGIVTRKKWDQFYFAASKYGPGSNYQSDFYEYGVRTTSPDTLDVYKYITDKDIIGTNTLEQQDSMMVSAAGDSFNVKRTYYMAGMQKYLWDREQETTLAYLIWTHAISAASYYEVRLNVFDSNYLYGTPDVDDRDGDGNRDEFLEWNVDKPGAHPIYREREENYWWTRGDDPGYREQSSLTSSLKADYISQLNKNHLIKGGIEANITTTKVENISWTLGVGTYRKDVWEQRTSDFAAYLQDKLEFEGIVAMVGLRFDAFDPNGIGQDIYYPSDYNRPYSEVGDDGVPVFIDPKKADMKYQLSPRVGISHPITDYSLLHFTYGHYFQRPDNYYLYRNNLIQSLTKAGNYIGSPNLEPEKTVAYEIGVEQQLSDDIKFDITGYYKDISNLMNWQKYVGRTIQNIELNVYTNADYGNIKGLEFTLSKRPGKFWGGNINYTFSVAKGRSSGATGGSGSFTSAKRMNILDFDQTHTANANFLLRTPSDFGSNIGPIKPFANWAATVLVKYGSGLPYSSYGNNKVNDKRMPWTSKTDLKISRTFTYSGYRLMFFMDVLNLFNRKNVNWIGSSQYYDSGDPVDLSIKGDPSVVRRESDGSYLRNSQAYSYGRQIRFGIALTF